MELQEEVIGLIAKEMSIDKKDIGLNSKLEKDLGFDELDTVAVVMKIEEHYGISISDDVVRDWDKVEDVIESVRTILHEEAS